LQWRENPEPDRSRDQIEREAQEARDKRPQKGGGRECQEIGRQTIHMLAPKKGEQRLNGITI
jgi:hypothetical protein